MVCSIIGRVESGNAQRPIAAVYLDAASHSCFVFFNMNQPAFKIQVTDTLQNSKKLRQIGFSESHAEVFVRIIESSSVRTLEICNKSLEQLIQDNRIFKNEVRADSTQLRRDFETFKTEMRADFTQLRRDFETFKTEMGANFETFKSAMEANFKTFKSEVKTEMRWHLVIVITVITALDKDTEWSKALESLFAIIASVL